MGVNLTYKKGAWGRYSLSQQLTENRSLPGTGDLNAEGFGGGVQITGACSSPSWQDMAKQYMGERSLLTHAPFHLSKKFFILLEQGMKPLFLPAYQSCWAPGHVIMKSYTRIWEIDLTFVYIYIHIYIHMQRQIKHRYPNVIFYPHFLFCSMLVSFIMSHESCENAQ